MKLRRYDAGDQHRFFPKRPGSLPYPWRNHNLRLLASSHIQAENHLGHILRLVAAAPKAQDDRAAGMP
ncbi:hypothetical protein D3C81_2263590 [compost metagenome]